MARRDLDVRLRVRGSRAFHADTRKAERGIRALGSETGRAAWKARAGEKAMGGLSSGLRAVGRWGAYGAAALGGAATAGVVAGVRLNAQWEGVNASFATFLGSAEKAEQFTERLRTVSSKSPLRLTEYAEGARLLLGFGMEAKKVTPLLQSVNKAVVATGGGAEQMKSVVDVLGEMSARGRVFGEDLTRMVDAGMPVHKTLQKELGLSAKQMARIGDEAISSEKALAAIAKGWDKQYGKAYKNAEDSFNFQFARSKKMFEQSLRLASEPIFNLLKDDALPAANREMEKFVAILSNPKLSDAQKLRAVRAQVSQLAKQLGREIDRADIDEKLLRAFEVAVPKVMEAAGRGGGRAAVAFIKGMAQAPLWAQLFTGALIAAKIATALGAWPAIGRKAGARFGLGFGAQAGTAIAASTATGGAVGGAAAGGAAARSRWKGLGRMAGRAFGAGAVAMIAVALKDDVENLFEDLAPGPSGVDPTGGKGQARADRRAARDPRRSAYGGGRSFRWNPNKVPSLKPPQKLSVNPVGKGSGVRIVNENHLYLDGREVAANTGRHKADREARR